MITTGRKRAREEEDEGGRKRKAARTDLKEPFKANKDKSRCLFEFK